jgi:HPt (histidine-containing phosphotransfer) domain-containing protein
LLDRVNGDVGLLNEVVGLFLGERPRALKAIQDAFDRGDAEGLARAAHYLKSMVGSLGAPEAYAAAVQLETWGRQGSLTGAAEIIAALEAKTERLRAALVALGQEDRT